MAQYFSPTSKAFQASVGIHAVFFLCLLIAIVWPQTSNKKQSHVFKLVTSHSVPSIQPQAESFPSIKSPDIAQAQVSEHKIPTPPPVQPKAQEESKQQPKTQPAAANKKLVSYDDFVKKHGKPEANVQKEQTAKPAVVPRINAKGFSSQLQQILVQDSSGGNWSSSSSNELSNYLALLKDKLDNVWLKPQSLAKLGHLEAQVEFTIEPNGALHGIRIVGTSGQPLFDDSVKQAFAKLNAAGRPPEGKRYSLRLTFKMEG